MNPYQPYIEVVKSVVGEDFSESLAYENLIEAIPNMNSLTLVRLVQKLESEFEFQADMSMITAETFGSLTTLKDFVEASR